MTAKAIIHANNVDSQTLNQIYTLCEYLDIEGDAHFMPDTHFGNGGPIGTVLKFGKSICPDIVGVDIGCFRGTTKIPLLNGMQVTIKDMVGLGGFYVYSLDENLNIVPGKAIALQTRANAEVMEVTVSGGDTIVCTTDHKFMLIDGTYKEARYLKAFDSLMPFNRSYQSRDGYEMVHTHKIKMQPTHKIVAKYIYGDIDYDKNVVHHKDNMWFNNDPSNIVILDKSEHSSSHRLENSAFTQPEFQEKKMKTIRDLGYYYGEEFLVKKQEVARKNITDYMNDNPEHFAEVAKQNGERGSLHFTNWNSSEGKICEVCGKVLKQGGIARHMKMHREKGEITIHNHKVLYTRKLSENEDVYCLNVEKYHNFALAAGVFVHNCGMRVHRLGEIEIDFAQLDADIKRGIPLGMRHRDAKAAEKILTHYSNGEQCGRTLKDVMNSAIEVQNRLGIRRNPVENQLGTLGGGNHFVEIGKDGNDEYWLTIHSGSRNFGLHVADYYQRKAKEITPVNTVPKGLESLPMDEGGKDYIKDMQVAQEFAAMNREVMARMVLRSLGVRYMDDDAITCTHNYISPRDNICRKGAISAYYGEDTIIPLNMQVGTIYAKGKGNKNYLYSAPHGAGRLFSRGEMKRKMRSGEYTVETFQKSMEGIYTTTADASTIDEAPMAYKPLEMILPYIEETADVIEIIKPVYNLKAQGD